MKFKIVGFLLVTAVAVQINAMNDMVEETPPEETQTNEKQSEDAQVEEQVNEVQPDDKTPADDTPVEETQLGDAEVKGTEAEQGQRKRAGKRRNKEDQKLEETPEETDEGKFRLMFLIWFICSSKPTLLISANIRTLNFHESVWRLFKVHSSSFNRFRGNKKRLVRYNLLCFSFHLQT